MNTSPRVLTSPLHSGNGWFLALVLLVALLVAVTAPPALLAEKPAGPGMGGPGMQQGQHMDGGRGRHLIMEAGHFIPEKMAELEALWNAHRKAVIPLKADMQVARIDLHEAMQAFPLDEAKAEKQFNMMTALRAKMFAQHRKLVSDVQKLVGQENWEKMRQNMRMHHPMGTGGHHGPMNGPMGGPGMGRHMGPGGMGPGGPPPRQ